jgi:hypothetical protein
MNHMNCDYKYEHVLTPKDRINIHLLLLKDFPMPYVCKKYGLTKQFLKYKHEQFTKKVVGVSCRGKTDAYYDDEMKYGSLDLKYEYNDELKKELNDNNE